MLSFSADFIVEDVTPDSGGGRVTRLILSSVFHYRTFAKAGYRTPRAHFVRLVTLERGKEPPEVLPVPGNAEETARHICDQRLLMAKLVDTLKRAHTGVIVVDKYFIPLAECPDSDPRTQALLAAVRDAAQDVPVIVGENDSSKEEVIESQEGHLEEWQEKIFKEVDVIVGPTLEMGGDLVAHGLLNLDRDTSRVPLQWKASKDNVHHPSGPEPGLALVAASKFDIYLLQSARLKALLTRSQHPYIGLLSEREMPKYSAVDLVCGPSYTSGQNWRECAGGSYWNQDLRSHVVVVGEYRGIDMHDSELGRVPGVVLQANYIESLLDDRYFRPVPAAVETLISLLWFGAIWIVFKRSKSFAHSVVYSVSLSLVMWWLLFYFVVEQWGFYLIVGAPGVFLIAGKFVDYLIGKQEDRKKEEDDAKAKAAGGH